MKKILAAAVLLFAMTACGGSHKTTRLEDTTWKLTRMDGIPQSAISSEADAFTISFNVSDTLVSGRTNCNRFFGKYDVKGDKLGMKNMGMTRMACPDMQYEDVFVGMLDRTNRYEIHGTELTLYNDKTSLAVFKAESANSPKGSAKRK